MMIHEAFFLVEGVVQCTVWHSLGHPTKVSESDVSLDGYSTNIGSRIQDTRQVPD